ncbi:LysR family transcriptional regulator [Oceanimonas baumannii]|uniref:DNA-binding transcriptional LysR family regulator n=1 Tax=Oceanimonas baumannii TaxID=129578 RepID=A0A235CIG6_9GAMM|nr:LysR family transcriptional regulator [Oceanimonas baumannii]OYD24330.1 LysR family transcriptional regulator [Oceanimonas baumannii]TDW59064.1 DNA-binding transcriptional LysR family regulator [Oceanimonas baumannii]
MDNLFQRLDLNLLRVFDVLMQSRNVTRAAERLNLSQSTVSHALARLRQALDDPLFVMTRKEMRPTQRALVLAAPVRQALILLEQGVRQSAGFDPASSQRTFRLAVPSSIEHGVVPQLVELLHRKAPGCRLAVSELINSDYEDALARAELDLVVSFAGADHLSERLLTDTWFRNPMVCLSGKDSGLPGIIEPAQLVSWSHVSTSNWGHNQTLVESWLSEKGLARHIGVWVPSFEALPRLLATGRYLAMVPELIGRDLCYYYPLQAHSLNEPLHSTYVLAQHPLTEFDPALVWFKGLLKEAGGQLPPGSINF